MKRIRVTPEMANEWLDNQAPNRKPSQSAIERYAKAMKDGIWTADPRLALSFNEDGKLVDGQHRLFAVIEYGKPVDFYAATVRKEVLDYMHECKHRSVADRLVMDGTYLPSDAKAVVALGQLIAMRNIFGRIWIHPTRMSIAHRTFRPDEIAAAFDWAKCDALPTTSEARLIYNLQPSKFRLVTYSMIGYLLAQKAPGVAEFLHQVCASEHPNRVTSVVSLRRQLGNSNYSPSIRLAMLAKAYNAQDAKIIRVGDIVEDLDGGCFPIL